MQRTLWAVVFAGWTFAYGAGEPVPRPAPPTAHLPLANAAARSPLRGFEEVGDGVFEMNLPGVRARFLPSGAEFASKNAGEKRITKLTFPGGRKVAARRDEGRTWPVRYIGPAGTKETVGTAEIRYAEIYPKTDLVWFVREGKLEYDWVVKPGGDPGRIRMRFGGGHVALDGPTTLRHNAAGIGFAEELIAYQRTEAGRAAVAGRFQVKGDEVRFQIGSFDRGRELVIDPALQMLTYLGGTNSDVLSDLQFDAQGYLYLLGNTNSSSLPFAGSSRTPAGGNDVFVAKVNPTTLQPTFVTYYGGSGDDFAYRFRVSTTGLIWLAGQTTSTNLPPSPIPSLRASSQGGIDAFVVQLSPAGQLAYSTYLGGSATDTAYAIDVDDQGSAYVAGYTESNNFPLLSNAYSHGNLEDAYVTKFLSDGTLAYSTCLSGSFSEFAWGVHVLADRSAVVTGYSNSFDYPHANRGYSGSYDAFVTRVSATGNSIVSSGLFGGGGDDQAYGSFLSTDGYVYLTGYTAGGGFPVTANAFQPAPGGGVDNFLLKVDFNTYNITYASYLGGAGYETGRAVVASADGIASVGGYTESALFPTLNPLQPRRGATDGYVTVVNTVAGNLLHSTPVGTTETSGAESVFGLRLDGAGRLWVAGWVSGPDLATLPGSLQGAYAGQTDGLLMAYSSSIALTVTVAPGSVALYGGQTRAFTATVANASTQAVTWSLTGPGTISSTGLYTAPPSVAVITTATVRATAAADGVTTGTATVTLYPPVGITVSPMAAALYAGQTRQITATVTNAANTAVMWTLTGPGTISASGLYTAPASITAFATATVTATAVADPTKTASTAISLYPPLGISLTPVAVSLFRGQTQQFTAVVTNAPTGAVAWTLTGPGTLSPTGLYTAPAITTPVAFATVTATAVADPTKFQSSKVIIRNPAIYWKPIEMLLSQ